MKKSRTINSLPLDCWCVVISFFEDRNDFLSLMLVVKGLWGYVNYVHSNCVRICFELYEIPKSDGNRHVNYLFSSFRNINLVDESVNDLEQFFKYFECETPSDFLNLLTEKFDNMKSLNFDISMPKYFNIDDSYDFNLQKIVLPPSLCHSFLQRFTFTMSGNLSLQSRFNSLRILELSDRENNLPQRSTLTEHSSSTLHVDWNCIPNIEHVTLSRFKLSKSLEPLKKRIRSLVLDRVFVCDEDAHFEGFEKLQLLRLRGHGSITKVKSFKNCDQLENLYLESSEYDLPSDSYRSYLIKFDVIEHLPKLNSLEIDLDIHDGELLTEYEICADSFFILPSKVMTIRNLPELRTLKLKTLTFVLSIDHTIENLEVLEVDSSEGVQVNCNLSHFESITFRKTEIDRTILSSLNQIRSLREFIYENENGKFRKLAINGSENPNLVHLDVQDSPLLVSKLLNFHNLETAEITVYPHSFEITNDMAAKNNDKKSRLKLLSLEFQPPYFKQMEKTIEQVTNFLVTNEEHFPHFETLSLKYRTKSFGTFDLLTITEEKFGFIKHLKITNFTNVIYDGKNTSKLESIVISNIDQHFKTIRITNHPNLNELRFQDPEEVDTKTFRFMHELQSQVFETFEVSSCPKLKELDLRYFFDENHRSFSLKQSNPNNQQQAENKLQLTLSNLPMCKFLRVKKVLHIIQKRITSHRNRHFEPSNDQQQQQQQQQSPVLVFQNVPIEKLEIELCGIRGGKTIGYSEIRKYIHLTEDIEISDEYFPFLKKLIIIDKISDNLNYLKPNIGDVTRIRSLTRLNNLKKIRIWGRRHWSDPCFRRVCGMMENMEDVKVVAPKGTICDMKSVNFDVGVYSLKKYIKEVKKNKAVNIKVRRKK